MAQMNTLVGSLDFGGLEYWALALVAVVLGLIAASVMLWRRGDKGTVENTDDQFTKVVQRDWHPTGIINFNETENGVLLLVEDDRVLELLDGSTTREARFRFGTRDEAVRVMKCYAQHIEREPEARVGRLADQVHE
jgi:hypothetical protein